MKHNINDMELENVNGGTAGALSPKYEAQQKVIFQNPNDPSVELTGIIRAVSTEPGADGLPYYIILVSSSEQEAALMIGRNYRVSEKYVIEVIG